MSDGHHHPEPPGRQVCLDHVPRIVTGGIGQSADPFGGGAFPCQPGGGPIFGCEAVVTVDGSLAKDGSRLINSRSVILTKTGARLLTGSSEGSTQ